MSATRREFQYDALTEANTVRLLQIFCDESNSTIGTLQTFSLDDLPSCGFTALSYVWGANIPHQQSITLNGYPFPVLQNIYPLLETICDTPSLAEKEWWWIDSICINQRNDLLARTERSSQVELMGRIYQDSKETIVWLGEADHDSDGAIEFLRLLASKKPEVSLQFKSNRKHDAKLLDKKKWKAVEGVMLRPWWTRVWTLQEFILPSDLIFFCGSQSISRRAMMKALHAMNICARQKPGLVRNGGFTAVWNRSRLLKWYKRSNKEKCGMGLVALMTDMGNCQSTDPRDRIYSLLGLARDQDRTMIGKLHYTGSVEEVYTQLVVSFVKTYRSLDIICLADAFHGNSESERDLARVLPSWVPDWRTKFMPRAVPSMACQTHIGNFRPSRETPSTRNRSSASYTAAGPSLPEVYFSEDLLVLTCNAIPIDLIDGLRGITNVQGCIQSTSPINTNIRTKDDTTLNILDQDYTLLDEIVRSLVLDRMDRYLKYPAPIVSFRRSFQNSYSTAIEKPEESNSRYQNWFQLNKDLLIRGRTLTSLSKTRQSSSRFKKQTPQFGSRFRATSGENGMFLRLIITNKGYVGMATRRAMKGDVVAVLLGCSIPVVLRKYGTSGQNGKNSMDDRYEFIGECYLHGFMNGEALESGSFEAKKIRLV